jgi:hypothetical protein
MEMSREQYQHEDTTNKPPTSHVMESSGIWMLLLLFFFAYVSFCLASFSTELQRPTKESALDKKR